MTLLTFGSQLRPNRSICRKNLAELRDHAIAVLGAAQKSGASEDALCEAHNVYVVYTVLCLLELTGHRPVEDPFCYRRAIAEGFAVIEDKAVTERHTCRVVVLCDTVKTQLTHYETHLRALAERLDPKGQRASLIPAIEPLIGGSSSTQGLPYFFLLTSDGAKSLTKSLDESTLSEYLGGLWPWPLNTGRHLIATRLREAGISSDLIDFQMGHLLPDRQCCGPTSVFSIASASGLLSPALEAIAADYGFATLGGLQRPRRPQPSTSRAAKAVAYSHGQLGPERRKAERDRAQQDDQNLVENLCANTLVGGVLNQQALDEVAEQLVAFSATEPHRVGRRLRYLWDWAYEHRPSRTAIRLPTRYFTLIPAASPFDRDLPGRYSRADNWRKAFADYLKSAGQDGRTPSGPERIAEIVFSAALHGALTEQVKLRSLVESLPRGVQRIGGSIIVMLPKTAESAECTWFPDGVTAALISEAMRGKAHTIGEVTPALVALLKTLEPASRIRNPWTALAEQARAYWQYQLPGFIHAAVSGEIPTRPLSLPTFARLLRGVRLANSPIIAPEPIPESAIPLSVGGKGKRGAGAALIKDARAVFTQIGKTHARGHNRSNRNMNASLSKALREVVDKASSDTPAIAKLCVHWATELADHGTRNQASLAFSTVDRYFNTIALPLIDAASEEDFLDLDAVSYESIYEQALLQREGQERAFFAGRLLEFHAYLEDAWCVENPDWSALPLPREELAALRTVDANFLTPREYTAALDLLTSDLSVDPHTRLRTSALLVLGYRFGTRISDALRLQYQDLVLDPKNKQVIVHVHSNIYGETKSEAGNRQIPQIGALTPAEWQVLTQLKGHFEERLMLEDHKASLFADPDAPRRPIERRLLLDRIHLAMRLISGDATLRYHHLRHSFATRLGALLFADLGESSLWRELLVAIWDAPPDPRETRVMLTGIPDISDDTLQALPCLLGHASAETSLQHYFHLMDGLVHAAASADLPALHDFAWVYVLGTDYDAVRKRRLRMRLKGQADTVPPVGPRWDAEIPEASIPAAKGRPPAQLPGIEEKVSATTLELTDRVLLACATRSGKVDGIADRLLLKEGDVERIVETARRFEARGGIARVRLLQASDELFEGGESRELDARLVKETRRLREGLREWQTQIEKLSVIKKRTLRISLESWHASTLPAGDTARFAYRPQINEVLDGLKLLGIPGAVLQANLRDGGDKAALIRVSKVLSDELKISEVKASTHVPMRAIELGLQVGSDPFGYAATFHRALYVALVHMSTLHPG